MSARALVRLVVRTLCALAFAGVFAYTFPDVVHRCVALFAVPLNGMTFPYLDLVALHVRAQTVEVEGVLKIAMTLKGGQPFPEAPVTLAKTGTEMLNVFALALAVWAAPAVSLRLRFAALPVTLICSLLAGALFLSLDIQETTLANLGESTLPAMPLEGTAENVAYFEAMKKRYNATLWIESILSGGGMHFLGVLSGLTGYAILPCLPLLKSRRTARRTAAP